VVIELQAQFGNKWARISTYLPGRTDNDVKNFWSTRQKRLARILRAPLPRRRPAAARNSGSAPSSSAPSHSREIGGAAAGGPLAPSAVARASEVSLCFASHSLKKN
jgi:myb proto-oncogene protein